MKLRYDARTTLAFGITLAAVLGITAMSLAVILGKEDASGKAQNVLNVVLPLFGTWVGTILAYYFSRDNFESATGSTERLIRQLTPEEKLRAIPVTSVMVKNVYTKSDLSEKVQAVLQELQERDFKRLPILKPSGVLQALLYREGLVMYLAEVSASERPKKTLDDLLKEREDLVKTPAFVGVGTTLAEAREAMEKIENCKVVLVTTTGGQDGPVVGLITNSDIAKHARV